MENEKTYRKLRCLIPNLNGKYANALALYDNNVRMTPIYCSVNTYLNQYLQDMEASHITVRKISIFDSCRGIAYEFSNGLILVPVKIYNCGGGNGFVSLMDVKSVYTGSDGFATIELFQLPGQNEPVRIHTECKRNSLLDRFDKACETFKIIPNIHGDTPFRLRAEDCEAHLEQKAYGAPLVDNKERQTSIDELVQAVIKRTPEEQQEFMTKMQEAMDWDVSESDDRKILAKEVSRKVYKAAVQEDSAQEEEKAEGEFSKPKISPKVPEIPEAVNNVQPLWINKAFTKSLPISTMQEFAYNEKLASIGKVLEAAIAPSLAMTEIVEAANRSLNHIKIINGCLSPFSQTWQFSGEDDEEEEDPSSSEIK